MIMSELLSRLTERPRPPLPNQSGIRWRPVVGPSVEIMALIYRMCQREASPVSGIWFYVSSIPAYRDARSRGR